MYYIGMNARMPQLAATLCWAYINVFRDTCIFGDWVTNKLNKLKMPTDKLNIMCEVITIADF